MKVGDEVIVNVPGKRINGSKGVITAPIKYESDIGDWWVNFGGPFDAPFLESQIVLKESISQTISESQ